MPVAVPQKIRYATLTDVGIRRSHNQDACAVQPATDQTHFEVTGHVFVVADGMGGHAVGEKASAKAVRDIPLTYTKHVGGEGPAKAIRRAFEEANAGIFQIGVNNPEFKGLGTTGTALFLRPEGAWIGHVGDSRTYRIRTGKVEQLTFDHSWVWEIARRQGIDPDELGDFKKNVIIRSLGPEAEVEVDVEGPHPVEAGDAFLLCSDGLTNHVKPDEIGAVVSTFPATEACAFLIALANLRGGSDNITALIVQVPRGDGNSFGGVIPAAPRKLAGLFKWWGRRVTWPVTALALGGGLVAVSIWLRSEANAAAVPAFGVAALFTLGGLAGLIRQYRKRTRDTDVTQETEERVAQVYKDYRFQIDRSLCERIAEQTEQAKGAAESAELPIDWEAFGKLNAVAEAQAKAGEWHAAFQSKCAALLLIATPLNLSHHKDEAFKPNWTTPNRAH
jgi:serine/threonine protein phosphatase PrpC